ncbi:hypothetical protein ASE74_06725 [Pedobacter sp. Leaf216]|uniref:DUF4280 domain-containing protein n=1 Tax=Pedobacter sp. Leaf216 TaxID=1735684 RepID=UPI0006F22E15|nr:DUF4280 domain-containing protein [Pedobacter sp. Leaf216]KQM67155.1 hypothetical protein ASE74_06725 [Pedobacter sp. Leaf216]
MSSSYLPSGVKINCTMMTVSSPQQLGMTRSARTVLSSKGALWLNIEDKKLSATFVCKSPAKFWNGLGAMFTGLAVGILCVAAAVIVVAAVVGTGGAAGVILAGMAAAASSTATGVIVGSLAVAGAAAMLVEPVKAVVGLFTSGHACDCTLESGSKWENYHNKVTFNKQNAILQKSMLNCINGGILQPFISPVIAQMAADKFAKNNNEEINLHLEQQLWMGFVSGFSGLADPLGTSLGIATGTYDYATGNYDFKKGRYTDALTNEGASSEEDLEGEISSATRDQIAGAVAGGGKGSLEAVEVITNQNRTIIREVIDQGGTYAQAERMTYWGTRTFAGEFKNIGIGLGVGFGFGVAGAITNHYIAKSYKEDKKELIKEVRNNRKELTNLDSSNSSGVIASRK